MKKDGAIRISFIICAVLILIAFRAGYYFGNTGTDTSSSAAESTSDLYLESETDASETMTDISRTANSDSSAAETDPEINEIEDNDGSSLPDISANTYYLKKNGDYLSVYQGNSRDVYFETGIRLSDLPEDIQAEVETGIVFNSLEELFGFLENYSS